MKRVVCLISLLWLACTESAFAQHLPPQVVARGYFLDVSRRVAGQFRDARLSQLKLKYGVRDTTAMITFVVHKSGRVESAQVSQTTGNPALDRTIESIVRKMRLPSIPPGFPDQRVSMRQQLIFH
ncbi:MAG: energy transducer TonB [Bradyrhizobium sp.]